MFAYGVQALQPTVMMLLRNSLSDTTRDLYKKHVAQYLSFLQNYFQGAQAFPCNSYHLVYYIAYLARSGLVVSSIRSQISAINFVHRLHRGQDLYQDFVVSKCLTGLSKLQPCIDVRVPITLNVLINLCDAITKLYTDPYYIALMLAMFSLAFAAFLRVGELTLSSSKPNPNLLQLCNLVIDPHSNNISIAFHAYKHKAPGPPFCLQVHDLPQVPVKKYLFKYLRLRGNSPGPLFVYKTCPVKRNQFVQTLNQCLKFLNLGHIPYKGHSFRIGAATHAIASGASYDQVKLMGRWKSNALIKYIRVHSFQTPNV